MKPLPDGGTIGVAACASPYDMRSELDRGVEWWESQGYRVKLGPGVHDRDDYVAGDPKRRADDLLALFADPEVDVVQSLQGGFGSSEMLPHLDFDLLAANPKAFIGYSDITSLHVPIRQRAGFPTFYGYGLVGMGAKETTAFSRERLLRVLRGDVVGEVPRDPDDPYVRAIAPGKASGPLVGGCLWLLMQTLGTPWELETDGAILFFEDTDAPPYYVDGQLTQLRHRGQARRDRRRRRRRHVELRLRRPAARSLRLARRQVDRGRARQAPDRARRAGALQAAPRARQAPRFHSAGRPGYARRGRTDADGGRITVLRTRRSAR